jgi:hypothetical protein
METGRTPTIHPFSPPNRARRKKWRHPASKQRAVSIPHF